MELKFTQEIKDKWLAELKSGKYKQGYCHLLGDKPNTMCCIGVLADCTEGLSNIDRDSSNDPYEYLENTVGFDWTRSLYECNDSKSGNESYPRDYSNVIPLIEALPLSE